MILILSIMTLRKRVSCGGGTSTFHPVVILVALLVLPGNA